MKYALTAVCLVLCTGCAQKQYLRGYTDGITYCKGQVSMIQVAVDSAQQQIDQYKRQCTMDRMELSTCRETLASCECK